MKITKVDVMRLEGLNGPGPIACRVYTDEGIYGDGEAALNYGQSGEAAFGQLMDHSRLIIGMNPLENEVIWDKLYKTTFWGQNGGPVVFSGLSAIDIALWDIKGKYFGVPVYMLLGGKKHQKLRGYASQLQFGWGQEKGAMEFPKGARSPEFYYNVTKKAMADGYSAVKIDFLSGADPVALVSVATNDFLDKLEEQLAAVRDAGGPKMDIILENHSKTTVSPAVAFGQRAEKYKIFYYEETCTPDPKLIKYVHDNVNIPIASGERIYTRWQYRPYLDDMSLQVLQPDLGTCGGITEVKKICDMAYTYDASIQLHACHTMLSTAAALHVEATIPNFAIHEDNDHGSMRPKSFENYCTHYYDHDAEGYFHIPELPGLGTEWNEDAMATARKVTIE